MRGKIVLITGATNGIGRVAALELARMGADVVVHGRSRERVDSVVGAITAAGGRAHGLLADLSRLSDVHALAADFKRRHDRLDVLINNAGAVFTDRQLSADGYEMTFALNHLGHFLLTHLLLDVIQASAPARIINVSSDAHRAVRSLNFDTLGKGGAGFGAYAQSKMMNLLFTFELARRLEGTGVTVNALHPGFVATGFGRNNDGAAGSILRAVIGLMRPMARTPEQGAQTIIYLASSPEVEGVTGQYFVDCKAVQPHPYAHNREAQRRLWERSEDMAGIVAVGGA
ncbi:MAG: SDR family oxidoreductase [Anaerolinea sp.]|nr:SDR family oxidoreductase [Anaerolinea sp.]